MKVKSEILPEQTDPVLLNTEDVSVPLSANPASSRSKPFIRRIRIISVIVIYIALLAGQRYFTSLASDPSITYNVYSICGVFSQIQVLITIYLVMSEAKTGYIIVALNRCTSGG